MNLGDHAIAFREIFQPRNLWITFHDYGFIKKEAVGHASLDLLHEEYL